jgi:tetratricopeptide (TPR) repeat protein
MWVACAIPLAAAYGLSGRSAEAVRILPDVPLGQASSNNSGTLAESWLFSGRTDEAARLGPQALELARARKSRGQEAWAVHILGEIAAHRDPPEHADGHYREALALAGELGMRPLVAHCHLGLGRLYQRTGKSEEAQEHLTTATTMYREMDMPFWLDQAEAELRRPWPAPHVPGGAPGPEH